MSDLHDRLRTLLLLVPYVYRHRGVPLAELAARLGMDEAGLEREIDFLLLVGRPPFMPGDMLDIYVEGGRVFVDLPQSLVKAPRFTAAETLALATAAQLFVTDERLADAATAMRVALGKILGSLPAETRALFEQLSAHFAVLPSGAGLPLLPVLRQALEEHRELEILHYSAGKGQVTRRVVQPLGLQLRGGVWYLVAHCTERDEPRAFRVSRIQTAALCETIFDPPAGFEPGAFLDAALTLPTVGGRRVVLRFAAEVARWVRERYRPEHLQDSPDGTLRVVLHDVSDEYVLTTVAALGGRAEILEPAELAERLRAEAREALARYA
ncbi:MAG TPA: WYL domain-containing protein [Myxococcota bacterium]|nr:WYL domain-containing protein [Myxococcota bacterium]HRY92347.1 WYL domain-containing protein [Myxococcota bacterium]